MKRFLSYLLITLSLFSFLTKTFAQNDSSKQLGMTDLIWAVKLNEFDKAESLAKNEREINTADFYGWTPLMYAISQQDLLLVELLSENGANVNVKDIRGYTPLMLAAGGENLRIVQTLIEKGAKIETETKNGFAAISFALKNERMATAAFLKSKGAVEQTNVDIKSIPFRTFPVDKQVRIKNPQLLFPLLKIKDIKESKIGDFDIKTFLRYDSYSTSQNLTAVYAKFYLFFDEHGKGQNYKIINDYPKDAVKETMDKILRKKISDLKADAAILENKPVGAWILVELTSNN